MVYFMVAGFAFGAALFGGILDDAGKPTADEANQYPTQYARHYDII